MGHNIRVKAGDDSYDKIFCEYCHTYTQESGYHPGACVNCGASLNEYSYLTYPKEDFYSLSTAKTTVEIFHGI